MNELEKPNLENILLVGFVIHIYKLVQVSIVCKKKIDCLTAPPVSYECCLLQMRDSEAGDCCGYLFSPSQE